MYQKEERVNGKKQALNTVSAGESLLILGLGLLILNNFIQYQLNFMVSAALLIGGTIAIIIACTVLLAPLKRALDDYLGIVDEEKKNEK